KKSFYCYCSKRHRKINFYRGDNVGGSKDLRMSNLKGILIFLVVFGHFIEIYKKEYYELFVFIYAFHMPVFIFIIGYFAKRMCKIKFRIIIIFFIFLLVFYNLIKIYKKEYYELFLFIYAFHMPVFIFISGYFAKRMRKSKIINLILLYLIFQTFFNVILFLTDDTPFQ